MQLRNAGGAGLVALALGGGGLLAGAERAAPSGGEPASVDRSLRSRRPIRMELRARPHEALELTVRLLSPERAEAGAELPVRVALAGRTVVAKPLHGLDPDLFAVLEPAVEGRYRLSVGEQGRPALGYEVTVARFAHAPGAAPVVVEAEPNDRPEEATWFELGTTVFASADDRPFIRSGEPREGAGDGGTDWYRFRLDSDGPRLVFVWLDLLDREVPVDVSLFRMEGGEAHPRGDGFERFEPERSTRFSGMNKFIARRLDPGVHYLRVAGNHPAYQLRSELHPVPPFDPEREGGMERAAREAIRVAMDYTLLKGDSWHANTPRVGAVDDRVHNVHAETAQCVACHPTHFSTRGALFAAANGHPVRHRASLQFLTERLYNNPRPFYGHPRAAWARMISASANVLSRMSVILSRFERQVAGSRRTDFHDDVAEYLKLYYAGRDELPPDESNGNRPLVSAFEVATHSWMVFDELHRRTGDPEHRAWRERIGLLIESAPEETVEDLIDLCYQTIALVRVDPQRHRRRIADNVERILARQRDDGQWPVGFGERDPPAEFQTAHALYTLALAGLSHDHPRVDKGVRYLLGRQHAFGAWYDDDDPDQPHPYENFSTPFRESQFAVMALSQLFPGAGGTGWQAGFAPVPAELDETSPQQLLAALDRIWETPPPVLMGRIAAALENRSVLVRQAAAACLGRVGDEAAVAPLIGALEDPSKLVQRAAAWALRQLGNRGLGQDEVLAALDGGTPRLRRAALQVLAQHHRYWTRRGDTLDVLIGERMRDPDPLVRLVASRSLWQWWSWAEAEAARSRIEDVFLQRMSLEHDPRVLTNLKEGFYNICDENTRYLYNNWVALLGREEDRATAIAGHRRSSARQAAKIAAVLRSGPPRQVDALLESLGSFPLRSGTYDQPGRYHRIGNDIETIQFYPDGAAELREPLRALLASPEPELRRRALLAGFTLRGTGSEATLGTAYLAALGDPDRRVREATRDLYREFLPGSDAPELLETLSSLLRHPEPEVKGAGLELVGELKLAPATAAALAPEVERALLDGDTELLPQALGAVPGLPSLWKSGRVVRKVAAELEADDWARRGAALQAVLRVDALGSLGLIRSRLDRVFARRDPELGESLLELAAAEPRLAGNPRMTELVAESLTGDSDPLRSRALDLVRRSPELQSNAAVREALAPLLDDPNVRVRQIASAIYTGETVKYRVDISRLLDFDFFAARVQPVFLRGGPDGKPCVDCHHNHGVLRLAAPDEAASPDEVARANYRSALKVVNLQQPERSLILVKPLATAATEGVVEADAPSHGGAVRWPEREASRQYRVILDWINGARLGDDP